MKFDFAHVIAIIFLLVVCTTAALSDRKNILENPNSYLPVNQNITQVYDSFFDEYATFQDGAYIISLSEAADFVNKQDLILKDDGV